jgi:hypothetical protein
MISSIYFSKPSFVKAAHIPPNRLLYSVQEYGRGINGLVLRRYIYTTSISLPPLNADSIHTLFAMAKAELSTPLRVGKEILENTFYLYDSLTWESLDIH